MQIFAEVRWRGGDKWEWGRWKWRFSLLSFTVFRTYMATRQLLGDTTVNDLGHISRSLDCLTSNFSKTVCDTAKVSIHCVSKEPDTWEIFKYLQQSWTNIIFQGHWTVSHQISKKAVCDTAKVSIHCVSKNRTLEKFSNISNKAGPISIIFGTENRQ